jgi:hypothetical protein
VDFPFTMEYSTSSDPDLTVLKSIASKCGIGGGATSDITVDYVLSVSSSYS